MVTVLDLPATLQQRCLRNHRIPRKQIANFGARLFPGRRPFAHGVDVELAEHLKTCAPTAAFPQLRAPVSRSLLFLTVSVVHSVEKHIRIHKNERFARTSSGRISEVWHGHGPPRASGNGRCCEEKACVPKPFASPCHNSLGPTCALSGALPAIAKRWYPCGPPRSEPTGQHLLRELRSHCVGE